MKTPSPLDEESKQTSKDTIFIIFLVLAILLQSIVNFITLSEVRSLRKFLTQGIPRTDSLEGLSPGAQAPDFNIMNTEGDFIALSDFQGAHVLLMFSSPTCPYCILLFPELERLVQEMTSENVNFIMLSSGTPKENQELKLNEGFSFEVLNVSSQQFIDYNIPGTPFFVLIDQDGSIQEIIAVSSVEDLEKLFERIK